MEVTNDTSQTLIATKDIGPGSSQDKEQAKTTKFKCPWNQYLVWESVQFQGMFEYKNKKYEKSNNLKMKTSVLLVKSELFPLAKID